MKRIKRILKILLWTYRVLMLFAVGFAILAPFAWLFFFILKKLTLIYLPYSAWLVFILFCAAGIWSIVSEVRSQKETKKIQSELDNTQQQDFEAEIRQIVEKHLAKYSYNITKGERDYTVSLSDPNRVIHIDIGKTGIDVQIFVGGWDEDSYDVYSSEELQDFEKEFSSDLDDWLNDRIVQVCFITDEDRFPYSFACAATDMDEVISKELESHSNDPWWIRILMFVFLISPPKPVLEIQITSANGVHDRTIPVHTQK